MAAVRFRRGMRPLHFSHARCTLFVDGRARKMICRNFVHLSVIVFALCFVSRRTESTLLAVSDLRDTLSWRLRLARVNAALRRAYNGTRALNAYAHVPDGTSSIFERVRAVPSFFFARHITRARLVEIERIFTGEHPRGEV